MKDHADVAERDEQQFLTEFREPLSALRSRYADCPSPALLLAAQAGTLPEDVAGRVTGHVSGCACCRLLSDDLADPDLLKATPEIEGRIRARVFAGIAGARKHPWRLPWRWLVPVGAAAAVVVAVVTANFTRRPAPQAPAGQGAAGQAARLKPWASRGGATLQPSSAFQLEKPPIRWPATAVMIWRGEEEAQTKSLMAALKTALDPYRADDFAEAARRLEAVAREHPTSPEAHFYLGICQLFLERGPEAVDSLEKARQLGGEPRAAESAWYLGLAYQRVGKTALAVGALKEVCGGSSPYAAKACAGLEELKTAPAGKDGR